VIDFRSLLDKIKEGREEVFGLWHRVLDPDSCFWQRISVPGFITGIILMREEDISLFQRFEWVCRFWFHIVVFHIA